MSLTKKDPSMRVAANDPHLVSLGGGRLSTAVTIHHIPIGDMTIGSSTSCSLSLNGSGVKGVHCTIYRSEGDEVTIVPEKDARILIDGTKITQDTNLIQGAMITIGNSNYLRFNNPAEAEMMRSAMGSNERISMPQIDFTQDSQRNSSKSSGSGSGGSGGGSDTLKQQMQNLEIESFYETTIDPIAGVGDSSGRDKEKFYMMDKIYDEIDINGLQCPKVFTADLVTVNLPAKDVLGQKFASFAKNLAENHRNIDKNVNNSLRNNQGMASLKTANANGNGGNGGGSGGGGGGAVGVYVNIPSSSNYIRNSSSPGNGRVGPTCGANGGGDYLTKVPNTNASPLRNVTNHNVTMTNGHHPHTHHHHHVTAYDKYPKPGTYGGLQIYPMNGINTEINNGSANSSPRHQSHQQQQQQQQMTSSSPRHHPPLDQRRNLANLSSSECERLEDMLKICTEYADRQNQSGSGSGSGGGGSITSSPIVQNRIKTNGSLPRDKKSPFYHDLSGGQLQQSFSGSNGNLSGKSQNAPPPVATASKSSGYENVRLLGPNRVEISGHEVGARAGLVQGTPSTSPKSAYENVVIGGKYVPQSPRTKIRTTCMSPKKEHSFNGHFGGQQTAQRQHPPPPPNPKPSKHSDYEQLIRTFEEKLKIEMQAIENNSRYRPRDITKAPSADHTPVKRSNKNINNLTLNIPRAGSLQNSPKFSKKPAPAPRMLSRLEAAAGADVGSASSLQRIVREQQRALTDMKIVENGDLDVEQMKRERKELLTRIQHLKNDISEVQKQEDEVLIELDLEKALVSAELSSVGGNVDELEARLKALQNQIHRLDAQRNAKRVMEENQQAKLKQSIEMKQDQVKKLSAMLKQKPNNDCLKEELDHMREQLENDRKTFEDLEFQYLEEESEWHAYREELHVEEKELTRRIDQQRMELQSLEKQELNTSNSACTDAKTLKNKMIGLLNDLGQTQDRLRELESAICEITGQMRLSSSDDDEDDDGGSPPLLSGSLGGMGVMSQSLFGSAELLCPKRKSEDVMSKSVNENMFYNNKIELPSAQATSTPKSRSQLRVVDIDGDETNADETDGDGEHVMTAMSQSDRVKFNLSLGSDDFEVNPLEQRRVPSQDDIDRICKVTSDAPISTKGATTKIFDSIKEIERNRQLLLAQQGHHVIEHERQKMHDLKKKSHDEARAQYLSMSSSDSGSGSGGPKSGNKQQQQQQPQPLQVRQRIEQQQSQPQELQPLKATESKDSESEPLKENKGGNQDKNSSENKQNNYTATIAAAATIKTIAAAAAATAEKENSSQEHRYSHPEYHSDNYLPQHQHHHGGPNRSLGLEEHHQRRLSPRPLSDANSELSCDILSEGNGNCKSSLELSTTTSGIGSTGTNTDNRYSGGEANASSGDDSIHAVNGAGSMTTTHRSDSVNSNETNSGASGTGSGGSGGGGGGACPYNERRRVLPKHQRPLTRYLPIFSPDLNLRHHIETAGHQIALCPHVFVDEFSCRGYLHKLGATFHTWARRWFVLDRQRNAFIYHADKSEKKPRGGAYFSQIDEVYLDHLNVSKSGRPHCTFIVKTKKRSYHLQAASDAAARIWIDAIITGAQGNVDY